MRQSASMSYPIRAQHHKSLFCILPFSERSRSPAGNWRRARRADTNVVVVKFDTLTETKNMHAGEAVECTSCKAMLSHVSKLHSQDDEQVNTTGVRFYWLM